MQIIIQILLSTAIIFAIYKILSQHSSARSRAMIKIIFILFLLFGIIIIFTPEWANAIAHLVGVQRGADLMLYILVVIFIFDKINSFYKEQRQTQRFAKLVRKIALDSTRKS